MALRPKIAPLIHRDLARALRQRRAVPRRWLAAIIPIALSAAFLLICYEGNPRKVGSFLYVALLGWGLFQATVLPGDLSAESFGEERRNGTLGLLYLTGLRSYEIFAGQLGGGLMIALNRLIALAPCLLLPFIMRAIPWSGYVATIQTLLCWAALCIALRILAASIFTDASASELFSQGCLVVFAGTPYLISGINKLLTGASLSPWWSKFSPANGIVLLFKNLGVAGPAQVNLSNLIALALAALLLLVSGALLRRSWQDEIYGHSRNRWRNWIGKLRERHRAAVRGRWLESLPYAWLAARHLSAFAAPWTALAVILALWVIGFFTWREFWLIPMSLWLAALLIAVVLRWTVHYSVARQISEDRSNGTLELLLTTPLSPAEIVDGQERLWNLHARPLSYVVSLVYLAFFLLGTPANAGAMGLASYAAIWIAIACLGVFSKPPGVWTTFWVCLNLGRPAYALKRFLWQGGGFVSAGIQLFLHADKLKAIPYGNGLELLICGSIAAIMVMVAVTPLLPPRQVVREKIIADMREIAAEPLPDKDDPRLKQWNITKRFFKEEPEKIQV